MKKIYVCMALVLGIVLVEGSPVFAQIVGQINADVPFAFHAGAAKFPAGNYIILVEDDSNSVMETQSEVGHLSALIDVRDTTASHSPQTAEFIFNHIGDRYFLARIFDEGNKDGSARIDSGYAKKYGVHLNSGPEEHVAAHNSISSN